MRCASRLFYFCGEFVDKFLLQFLKMAHLRPFLFLKVVLEAYSIALTRVLR